MDRVSIGSGNGLSPVRNHAITWTNVNLLSIWPLGTNFGEIPIKIYIFHTRKCIGNYRLWNGGHYLQREMSYWMPGYGINIRIYSRRNGIPPDTLQTGGNCWFAIKQRWNDYTWSKWPTWHIYYPFLVQNLVLWLIISIIIPYLHYHIACHCCWRNSSKRRFLLWL